MDAQVFYVFALIAHLNGHGFLNIYIINSMHNFKWNISYSLYSIKLMLALSTSIVNIVSNLMHNNYEYVVDRCLQLN